MFSSPEALITDLKATEEGYKFTINGYPCSSCRAFCSSEYNPKAQQVSVKNLRKSQVNCANCGELIQAASSSIKSTSTR